MNSVADAFRRAAGRGGPLFNPFMLFRKAQVDADFTGWTADEIALATSEKVTVWDWLETAQGTLKWQDFGTDGTTTKGELTLFADPLEEAPGAILADDGQWYVVEEVLGQDSLRAAYRLEVSRWAGTAPRVRSAAP